mgnify:CR=1 FL=1
MIHNCPRMATYADLAYLDGPEAKDSFKTLGFPNHGFIENDGAQCHIIANESEIVLAFRGTEPSELNDLKADLNAWPDRAHNGHGLVHNGFQEEVNKLWPTILERLHVMKTEGKHLFICGHSLGGAMATIAASRLYNTDYEATALYTYGSPRVGTRRFVRSFSGVRHYRHVNNNDIVTAVPFALLGYVHHSKPRYINYYGKIRNLTPWQRVKDKLRGRWRAIKKGQPFDGAYDHSMKYYERFCKENADGQS